MKNPANNSLVMVSSRRIWPARRPPPRGGRHATVCHPRARGETIATTPAEPALRPVDTHAGQQYTVDSGHLVASHEALPIEVEKVGGLESLPFSDEGFVPTLTGAPLRRTVNCYPQCRAGTTEMESA
jgi:hypothetical protein